MSVTTDDDLVITRVRLCDCGKPLDHPDGCASVRPARQSQTRSHPSPDAQLLRAIRNALAELELISHAPTATWDKTSRDASGHSGGNRPPGSDHEPRPQDLAERLDWYESYHHKTVTYFRHALSKPNADHLTILEEIQVTVSAWKRRPIKQNAPMSMADSHWKLWVATSNQDAGTLARQFGCTRQVIYNIHHRYARASP